MPDTAATIVAAPKLLPVHKGSIDISTGLYIRQDDDLILNTVLPVVLRRTYLSRDRVKRQFGIGTTHPGEWWLYGDGDPRVPWAELILADGARIRFTRISPGDTQKGAILRHDSTPTEFGGALLVWNGSLWELRFRDRSIAVFTDCQTGHEVCSLVERQDAHRHRIRYIRDASGTLLRMESEGQSIVFGYDDHQRISGAQDSSNNFVIYTYDLAGRLVQARSSNGVVRDYRYDDRDELVAVREPGRLVENWFDTAGRVVR